MGQDAEVASCFVIQDLPNVLSFSLTEYYNIHPLSHGYQFDPSILFQRNERIAANGTADVHTYNTGRDIGPRR